MTALPRQAMALIAAVAVVGAQQAMAQDGSIEEIVVTAQKRAETAQDVPISIVAVTGDELARTGQTDFLALAGRTPTLQYSQAGGESQIYIRGIGSNLLAVGADPSVAIHLDGVYLGRPNMGMNQFLDVERVEVLRGPQGTLYGRNATGGSINIISNQPTDTLEGYVGLGTGSFSRFEAEAAVGGPINDQLGFRVAVRDVQDDGYVEDLDPRGSNKLDDQDLTALRGILKYTPTDTLDATLSWDWSDFSNGNTAVRPNDAAGTAAVNGAVPTGSILEQRNDLPTFMDWETGGPTLTVNWDLGNDILLTSVTAYKTFEMDFLFNTEGTEVDVTRTTERFDTEQITQELRLTSTGDGPLQWIAGLYFLDENKFGALGLVRRVGAPNLRSFNIFAENKTEAWAAFGEVSYALSDRLTLTAGLRYSDEEKEDFNSLNFVLVSPANPEGEVEQGLFGNINYAACGFLCPFQTRTDSQSWDDLTPKIGLEYQYSDDVLLYASYTEGFKSGGYNDYQPTNPVYDQETIKSFEVGAKSDWMDGRLRINGSIFFYDYEDLQVTTFFNSLTLVSNAATAEVFGIDLELVARPTDDFEYGAAVSFLDATYDDFNFPYGRCSPFVVTNFNDPGCADVPGTRPFGDPRFIDASGNNLNNAPEFKGNVYAQYFRSLGDRGSLSFFGQVSHTGEIFFNAANDEFGRQESITLLDAAISWTNAEGNFEVSLYGKNLSDEEYFHNIVQFTSSSLPPPATAPAAPGAVITDPFSIGHSLGYPAPGRTWGLRGRFTF